MGDLLGRQANTRRGFRELLSGGEPVLAPGAYDAMSARLVEAAGFPAVYMSGFGVTASLLGRPDIGLLGMSEMAQAARRIVAALDVPVIADADTGYGNALNVRRTVALYESAGVAGLHLEDQQMPKRCGHLAGKVVVSAEEFAAKIRAAVEARTDPDLVIIARTDAIAVNGLDDALRRAEAAVRAGADMLFVEAPTTEEQIERVARAFDTPLLFNYAPGGRSPLPPFARLRELGYAVILLPVDTLFVAARAIQSFLRELKEGDAALPLADRYIPFKEFNELIGVPEQFSLGQRYSG